MTNTALRLASVLLALGTLVAASWGQTSPPVCTAALDQQQTSCTGGNWSPEIQTCQHATVTCPTVNGVQIEPLGITFGYAKPSGSINGTIVFFSPGGGTSPWGPSTCPQPPCYSDAKYFNDYLNTDGFEVMQTVWDSGSGTDSDSDWEDTGYSGSGAKNVAYAAGRAAAFLSWVNTNLYAPIHQNNPKAGMCAQGNSAGGGAIAYILAWYGGYSYLDHAEFLSSPPLSDIDQGCATNHYPVNPIVTVCPTGQLGCNPNNNPASWQEYAVYTDAVTGVQQWADDSSLGQYGVCRGSAVTSTQANSEWKAMSIVDGNVNTFNYPQTSLTAWLCSSDAVSPYTMNNSSSQAQLFFANFTSASQLPPGTGLLINGVVGCNGVEDVTNAYPTKQLTAIENDMIGKCVSNH